MISFFSKVAEDYMRDPFNQNHIEAFKKKYKGFPYSVNMHTLTDEQVANLNDKKNCVNVNGECVNQLYLAALIFHIFYAAQCDTTTSKNLTKPEVVLDLQYVFLFLFAGNTLNSTRYKMDDTYAIVFDINKRNPGRFDDEKIKAFGACVATVHIILALMACSIVSDDPDKCHAERKVNATMFKRAFASIDSSPKHNFAADCAVLCKYTFSDQFHIDDAASH